MLEIGGLSVRYGQHRALESVSLRVAPGEIVVILGANGAGKSTLLKAASGICEGEVAGSVRLDGSELLGLPADRIVERGLALVPEGRGVFGDLTVEENLRLGAYGRRARGEEATNRERVLGLFPKLAERARQTVRTMSGGEQQMVAIGRAMMSAPRILALDEPSLGLSPLLSKELFRSLARVRDLGLGVLLVEQNARASLAIADRGYLLENARLVHEDDAQALAHDPAVQAAYLGAGGQAAPHTHDDASAPAAAPALARAAPLEVRPRSTRTVSADTLLGRPIGDLVADAVARTARPAAPPRAGAQADGWPMQPRDPLAAAVEEIERAARAARRRPAPTPRAGPNGSASDGEPSRDEPSRAGPARDAADAPPVTIEIWRAPRVEVYRRRPGKADFDRH